MFQSNSMGEIFWLSCKDWTLDSCVVSINEMFKGSTASLWFTGNLHDIQIISERDSAVLHNFMITFENLFVNLKSKNRNFLMWACGPAVPLSAVRDMTVYDEQMTTMRARWKGVKGATGYMLTYRATNATQPTVEQEVIHFSRENTKQKSSIQPGVDVSKFYTERFGHGRWSRSDHAIFCLNADVMH